jgi:type IV secretion system protein VirB8
MNKPNREALDAYYAEAESWSRDRQEALRGSRRTAWLVAGAAAIVALFEAFALMLLTPLKTVIPYTLLVDRNTGFVQALKPLDPDKVAPDTALTQSFLVQYVIARESFDVDVLDSNYHKVALWSAEQARNDYVTNMQVSSPLSPLVRLPRTTIVETRIKSVSPVGRNVALVRFDTVRRDAGGQIRPAQPWVAVIRYRYSGEPMQLQDRLVNPLGFQVLRYRRDPEAVPAEPEIAPAPVSTATTTSVVTTTNATVPAAGTTVPVSPLPDAAAAAARAARVRATSRPAPYPAPL